MNLQFKRIKNKKQKCKGYVSICRNPIYQSVQTGIYRPIRPKFWSVCNNIPVYTDYQAGKAYFNLTGRYKMNFKTLDCGLIH